MRTIAGTTWSVEDAQAYIKARIQVDENGCWVWQQSAHGNGRMPYGKAAVPRDTVTSGSCYRVAHRLSHEAFVGPALGLHVCHRCDVPRCCNPEHLFLGTQADNIRDAHEKGRAAVGERHPAARISDADIAAIESMWRSGMTQREIGAVLGVRQSTISRIMRGKTRRTGRRALKPTGIIQPGKRSLLSDDTIAAARAAYASNAHITDRSVALLLCISEESARRIRIGVAVPMAERLAGQRKPRRQTR